VSRHQSRPSNRRIGRKVGAISFHWGSLSSQRPYMPFFSARSHPLKMAE
jgi:hypothetical protein